MFLHVSVICSQGGSPGPHPWGRGAPGLHPGRGGVRVSPGPHGVGGGCVSQHALRETPVLPHAVRGLSWESFLRSRWSFALHDRTIFLCPSAIHFAPIWPVLFIPPPRRKMPKGRKMDYFILGKTAGMFYPLPQRFHKI